MICHWCKQVINDLEMVTNEGLYFHDEKCWQEYEMSSELQDSGDVSPDE